MQEHISQLVSFRRLQEKDFDLVVDLRLDFVSELKGPLSSSSMADLRSRTADWLSEQFRCCKILPYAGFIDGQAVCCASLLLQELPPLPQGQRRTTGHVLNFFTYGPFRKSGIGFRMMEFVKADAKNEGITKLTLNATDMGESLYKKSGFTEYDKKDLTLSL